jgi:hypothetical protein
VIDRGEERAETWYTRPRWPSRSAYSFQDVLALRTFVRLRENTSLQKIRAAIGNLRNIGEVSHLASYRLVADQGGNIQLLTANEAVDLGKNPGQLQLVVGHRRRY